MEPITKPKPGFYWWRETPKSKPIRCMIDSDGRSHWLSLEGHHWNWPNRVGEFFPMTDEPPEFPDPVPPMLPRVQFRWLDECDTRVRCCTIGDGSTWTASSIASRVAGKRLEILNGDPEAIAAIEAELEKLRKEGA